MPPSSERDSSGEGERRPRHHHQHSMSQDQSSRALVPMWDSSDPERAPPPLPLNPQSPSFTSRAGTSSVIQSAHAAMTERARESAAMVPALAKRMADGSSEKALVKGAASHRRMQSLQQGSVRDLSLMIEGSRTSPARSPDKQDRPCTPTHGRDSFFDARSYDGGSAGSTPNMTPLARPAMRRPATQSILSESTPPQSSTMLALQTMGTPQPADFTTPNTNTNSTIEGLSTQILGLTNIAQALHKEMNQLSRRSKDNATDLLSLKEVTSSRDEDIRKTLRDLVGNMSETSNRITSHDHFNGLYIDNKPHCTSPPSGRPIQLARVPSIKSFTDSIDRASVSTPSLSAAEQSASMALLEKIVRSLGSHDGHESLLDLLHHISDKLSGMATAAKVDELAEFVREHAENAIIPNSPARGRDMSNDNDNDEYYNSGSLRRLLQNGELRRSSVPSARGSELLNEDLIKIIRSVKDSVAQGGGLTAEVKALVRELRGEVLGMGRELGKRLERMGVRAMDEADSPTKDDVSRVIDEGLEQMKEQLNHVLREHRRQSQASTSSQKTIVDYQEIYNAMRAALRDNEASRGDLPDLSREDVIEAVREAWENYKPEIEVQQVGLERDEVLVCLKEGLRECLPPDERRTGATREEVFKAVVEGLKHFVPPQMHTAASMSRDEIIEAVRDCLEEFEFPAASAIGNDMTHMDMVHAVKEGLEGLDLGRGDAFMNESHSDEVLSRLQEIMDYLRTEFLAVSEEAKQNVAANGRDTEQVLDATKDGLESLRAKIESYVDRVNGSTGQQELMELMESLSAGITELKTELPQMALQANETARQQLQAQLEELRDAVQSSMVPATRPQEDGSQQVLEALHNGLGSLRQEILRPRPETNDIMDALQEGLSDIRAGLDKVTDKPVDLTDNDELLETLQSGIESIRADIESLRQTNGVTAVAAVAAAQDEASEQAIVPADMVKQADIKNLEVLLTQLRIKVEAMEEPERHSAGVNREDLDRFEDMLRNVQQDVSDISSREAAPSTVQQEQARDVPVSSDGGVSSNGASPNGDAATRDDFMAIETLMRNTKARLDDLLDGEQAVRKDNIDAIETLLLETRESMGAISAQMEDKAGLEGLLGQLYEGIEELKAHAQREEENDDRVSKTDVEAVETVVLEMKTTVDAMAANDFTALPTKDQVAGLETLIKENVDKLQVHSEASGKAMDDRQAEIVGVADRVTEVKTLLQELHETAKEKLSEGSTGLESLSELVKTINEKMDKNDAVGQDVKDMFEHVKTQFDESKEVVAGARLEANEKLQEATESLAGRIDEKVTALMEKYDEFRAALEEKSAAGKARDAQTEEAVAGTKAVAEELKLLIDTLGSAVTDSLEKMEEASKIVFTKVEEVASRAEETHIEAKTEHQETRSQVEQAAVSVQELKNEVSEHQPRILEAIKDVLLLVGEHFEHSKSSTTELQDRIVESKPPEQPALPPPDPYDDAEIQHKLDQLLEGRYDDSEVRQRLQELAEQKYDDSLVQDKLDTLVDHSAVAQQAFARLDTLDQVHLTVANMTAELSHLVSSQKQRIADEHEDREKTLHDTNVALERNMAVKEHLETTVASLVADEQRLRKSISSLRAEQESLIKQKTRLTGDVSSLETAMRLRREELADMEGRADRLERRILEGVMDHSRVLLMAKNRKDGDKMSRKRSKKTTTATDERPKTPSKLGMAFSSKRSLASSSGAAATAGGAQPGSSGRRIASLSQMNNNLPSGSVKRSNSVKTQLGGDTFRKRSWGGLPVKGFHAEDKENVGLEEMVEEEGYEAEVRSTARSISVADSAREDEHELEHGLEHELEHELDSNGDDDDADDADDGRSEAGTLRRSSLGTTVLTSTTGQYTESDAGSSDHGESMLESEAGANGMVLYGQQ